MYATMQANSPSVYMIDKNGKVQYVVAWTTPPTSGPTSITDRNGNIVSQSNGVYKDTLNTTALSVLGSAPSNTNLSYTAPSGANASYVVSYRGYIVRTAFGYNNITEYNSGTTQIYLVDKITLPDTSFYQFNYEQTPGFPSDVTARIASVTLPTGGQITYTYNGGSGGHITCADGSASGLTRQTPDGTWTYVRTPETGAAYVTKATDPQNNSILIQFQGIYETQRDIYQGAAPSFSTFPIPESTLQTSSLLQEIQSCYNTSITTCTNTAITLPITQRTSTAQLSGASSWASAPTSQVVQKYNTTGSLTEQDDYDYGVGTVGALVKKTAITYASLTNITGFPHQITVTNSSGTVVSQMNYNYGDTVTATSGTPQHTTPPGSRGNVLSVNRYTHGSTYLTQTTTYFDTGNVKTVADVNGATTTFNYSNSTATCGNSFPTSVSEPLSLSRSMTWNCTGGVQVTSVDENNQNTTTTYNDPYFWRPASVTDPLTNPTSFAYSTSNPAWVTQSLTFNGNHSIAETGTGFDGLGRQIVLNHQQAPGATSYDQVTQSYDSNGRPWKTSTPCLTTGSWTCPTTASTTTYDALDRPLQITGVGVATITYSYSGNDVFVTVGPAPSGENTKRRQLEYDALGRLTSVCEITAATGSGSCAQQSAQNGFWTKYTYDALGNLTAVTQNAQSGSHQTRAYTFDEMSRLTSETNPESGTTTYIYDTTGTSSCNSGYTSNGDLVRKVDANGVNTCNYYDALHRLTDVGTSGSGTVCRRFRYDATTGVLGTRPSGVSVLNVLNRLAEAETDTCASPITQSSIITDEWFSYSPRGEQSDLFQYTTHSGSTYYHTAQTYWPHGLPEQLSSNISGLPTITYGGTIGSTVGLDGEGRLTQVTASSGQNPVTGMNYNPYGTPPQLTATFGSGDSDVVSFDANTGRTTKYQFNVGTHSDIGTLTWNANQSLNQLAITDGLNSADSQTCTYSHDDLSRIASVNCGASTWQQNFGYDAFGNITKTVPTGGTGNSFQPTYSSATNHFSSIPGTTVSYDSNGDVLSDGSHTYAWDAYGKATSVDGVGLTYDALGRMVEQNRSGSYTQIVYAPGGGKLALMTGQTLQKGLVPLPGGGEAVYNSNGLLYYGHSDHLGSMRLGSTPTRTMYFDLAHAPFGEVYASSGTTDPAFTGERQDTVSGLFDFPAREYSIQGRWPSPDPSGLGAVDPSNPQSWNRYAYVLNNPLSAVDPQGLCGDDNGGFDDYVTCDDEGDVDIPSGPINVSPIPPPGDPGPLGNIDPLTFSCPDPFEACNSGSLNAGAQPNLAGMFNEGPGGYSYGGVDALVAVDCAAANNPADNACWGVKLSLNGGLLQGSWSLDGYAAGAKKPVDYKSTYFPATATTPSVTVNERITVPPDPLAPNQLFSLKPGHLPNATSRSYVCPALVTQIRQLQLQSVGNPSIASQLAALQARYQKSCS